MPGIDVSMYGAPQSQQANPLATVAQFAYAQNALNQNALFQQTYRARQAMGPLAQQSIGPDGQMDYNKFAVLISTHPDTAWMAPDVINGIVQRQLVQADTVLKNLQIGQANSKSLGDMSSALIDASPDGKTIDQRDVMGMTARMIALHEIEPQAALKWAATIGRQLDPKTGLPVPGAKYDPMLAYQHILQFGAKNAGASENIARVLPSIAQRLQTSPTVGPTGAKTTQPTISAVGGTGTPLSGTPAAQPGGYAGGSILPNNERIVPGTATSQDIPPGAPAQVPPAQHGFTSELSPVQQGRLKGMVPYTQATNDAGTKSLQMNQLMDEMDKARSDFKTGGGMDGWVALARTMQSVGFPSTPAGSKDKALIDRVAGGDLGGAQEYQKLQAQLAAAVLKNALMPGAGRILQSEYQTFTKANANWDTDPRAIDKMFTFMRTQNAINIQRMRALNFITQRAEKGELPPGMSSIADFEPWFNNNLIKSGVISGPTQKLLKGATESDPTNVVAPPAK